LFWTRAPTRAKCTILDAAGLSAIDACRDRSKAAGRCHCSGAATHAQRVEAGRPSVPQVLESMILSSDALQPDCPPADRSRQHKGQVVHDHRGTLRMTSVWARDSVAVDLDHLASREPKIAPSRTLHYARHRFFGDPGHGLVGSILRTVRKFLVTLWGGGERFASRSESRPQAAANLRSGATAQTFRRCLTMPRLGNSQRQLGTRIMLGKIAQTASRQPKFWPSFLGTPET